MLAVGAGTDSSWPPTRGARRPRRGGPRRAPHPAASAGARAGGDSSTAAAATRSRRSSPRSARVSGASPQARQRIDWGADVAAHQRDRLRDLLATRSSGPRSTPGACAASTRAPPSSPTCRTLPVMTEAQMMDAFDEVVTDRRLGRRASRSSWPPPPRRRACSSASTSASPPAAARACAACSSRGSTSTRKSSGALHHAAGAARAAGGLDSPQGGSRLAGSRPPSLIHSTGLAAARRPGGPASGSRAPWVRRHLSADRRPSRSGLPGAADGLYPGKLAQPARQRAAGRLATRPLAGGLNQRAAAPRSWREGAIQARSSVLVVDESASTQGLCRRGRSWWLGARLRLRHVQIAELIDEGGHLSVLRAGDLGQGAGGRTWTT